MMQGYRTYILSLVVITVCHAADKSDKPADTPEWQAKFEETYRLADGQNAKFLSRPFIPERDAYHAKHHPQIANHPGQYTFRYTKDGKLAQNRWSSISGDVASALRVADINPVNLEGTRDVFDLPVEGDWIFRSGAPREAVLADVQRELTQAMDGRVKIEPVRVEKDVIVARGKYAQKPLENPAPREPNDVHLFTDVLDTEEGSGGGTGKLAELLRHVGEMVNQQLINETDAHKGDVSWVNNRSAHDAAKSPEQRDLLLKNLAAQTSLDFKVERRTVDAWKVTDTSDKAGGL
jgi:hypothetical protein